MIRLSKPMAGLVALAIAAIIVSNLASPAIPGGVIGVTPPEDHVYSPQGCYCHNLGLGIWINGSDLYSAQEVFAAEVESGKPLTLQIITERISSPQVLPPVMAWMPKMSDNAQFKFDPQEVKDNSPQDRNSKSGNMDVLFKIVAPDKSGTYSIALSVEGNIISAFVTVKSGSGSVSSGSAAIVHVESPSLAESGGSVGVKVTLQNADLASNRLYMYVTDRATGEVVLAKVYSEGPVPGNGTIILSGAFEMPNRTLGLTIHSGHVQDGVDSDDALLAISITVTLASPPVQAVPFSVLAREWVPWVAIVAVSLVSVPVVGSYAVRRKRLFSRPERLRMAVVECGSCGVCKGTMVDLGRNVLSLLSPKVGLAPIVTAGAMDYAPVDVAFVVGSVRSEEDIRAVQRAREKAKVLVAFGACSVFGLSPAGEAVTGRLVNSVVSKDASPSELVREVKPLGDYVKVDLTVPGCPPPLPTVRSALETILYRFDSTEKK